VRLIDSHTGGEPTRVIIEGGPDLGGGSLDSRRQVFAEKFDHIRTAVILEPRGFDAMVGALLCEPTDASCVTGAIFFNNVGYLGMCGHGAIGIAVTLAYLGRIDLGRHKIETPVGIVQVELVGPNEVRVENVASYCHRREVTVAVDGLGQITGSIAWGGNWFFLVDKTPVELKHANIPRLTATALQIQQALIDNGITGADGAMIDHIELFGPAHSPTANSRNFVLCPGGAYDRSPCGTGTSAKVACLAARDELQPGEEWVQESIIGSQFTMHYRLDDDGQIIPTITGRAFVSAETMLVQQPDDPFADGIK